MKGKLLATAVGAAALSLSVTSVSAETAAAEEAVLISFNDQTVSYGRLIDERTMVPVRPISQLLGYAVEWKGETRTVVMSNEDQQLVLKVDDHHASINHHDVIWNVSPLLVDGTTYVPLRPLAEGIGLEVSWDGNTKSVALQSPSENPVTIQTEKIEQTLSDPDLTLQVQYPRIEGLDNAEVQQKINDAFKQYAETAQADGLETFNELTSGMSPERPSFPSEVNVNYEVTYNQGGWLSVLFEDYQYMGGAHGMTYRTPYTFNLQTGTSYQLSDLFKEDAAYVDLINRAVKEKFAEDSYVITPFKAIDEDQRFYLSNEGLVIYFELYEYTAYAAGFPEIVIPYTDLEDMLKESVNFSS